MSQTTETNPVREAYYQRLASHEVAPLWTVFRELLTSTPRPRAVRTTGAGPLCDRYWMKRCN